MSSVIAAVKTFLEGLLTVQQLGKILLAVLFFALKEVAKILTENLKKMQAVKPASTPKTEEPDGYQI